MKHLAKISVFVLLFSFSNSFAQTNWVNYVQNPVLSYGSGWEASSVYFPFVLKDGDTYKMWYNGWDGAYNTNVLIGYATSLDGINWEKWQNNPVLQKGLPGSWDDSGVFNPTIIFDGSVYHMWYGGWDGTFISDYFYKNISLGYATSEDGINWTKFESNPVFGFGATGEWDDSGFYGISILSIDSVYHLWYGALDGTNARIGHATSMDGISWERDANNPVLDIGDAGEWDHLYVFEPSVFYNTDSSRFEMWYAGGNSISKSYIGFASSTDGISWKKDTTYNPLFGPGSTGWDKNNIGMPFVLRDEDRYKMWYFGQSDLQHGSIGYATDSSLVDRIGDFNQFFPMSYFLDQNYPNPFNPSTTIEFTLPQPEYTTLKVYNILGAEVASLVSDKLQTGGHKYQFDGSRLASGVYYYQVTAGEFREVKKMILLR